MMEQPDPMLWPIDQALIAPKMHVGSNEGADFGSVMKRRLDPALRRNSVESHPR